MGKTVHTSPRFEKDVKLMIRRCKSIDKLRCVIDLLVTSHPFPSHYKDHPLKGQWKGYKDLHLELDWILIYKFDSHNLWLVRTGTHVDLFNFNFLYF